MNAGKTAAETVDSASPLEHAATLKTSVFWMRIESGLLRLEAQRLRDEAFLVRADKQLRQ